MAGLVDLLAEMINSLGSSWVSEERFFKACEKRKLSTAALPSLIANKQIINMPVDGTMYYSLENFDRWETLIASNAIRILNSYRIPSGITEERINEEIDKVQLEIKKTLHPQQREAVLCAIKNGVAVITGGPGTGKTCVLECMTMVMRRLMRVDIRFTAPTGKAARRITESTGIPAKTTQKELGITWTNKKMKMFGGDILIIDEVSMLDMETAYHVFKAISNGQKLILVGDIDQLPSVGPGAVLRDLIFSDAIPVVQLTKTYRQDNSSTLFSNICRIRNGEWQMEDGCDFEVHKANDDALKQIVDLFLKEYEKYGVENVACLLPYRKAGILCSDNVNNILQSIVNPTDGKPCLMGKTETGLTIKFTEGDPVMQLENKDKVANGDVGIVERINNGVMTVRFTDTFVTYTKNNVSELSLAYSMSINKSQGSEYKSVIMALTSAHSAMLKRNLVYTGVTRAKERCILLQEDAAMIQAIGTEDAYERDTFLAPKLLFFAQKAALTA